MAAFELNWIIIWTFWRPKYSRVRQNKTYFLTVQKTKLSSSKFSWVRWLLNTSDLFPSSVETVNPPLAMPIVEKRFGDWSVPRAVLESGIDTIKLFGKLRVKTHLRQNNENENFVILCPHFYVSYSVKWTSFHKTYIVLLPGFVDLQHSSSNWIVEKYGTHHPFCFIFTDRNSKHFHVVPSLPISKLKVMEQILLKILDSSIFENGVLLVENIL